MNGKRDEASPRISVDELFRPTPPEMNLNQPVEAASRPPDFDVPRSTTDPLQISFATPDIAAKLHNSDTKPWIKVFALVFVGGPMTVMGIGLVVMTWRDPHAELMRLVFGTLVGLAIAGFWPYVIFANRRKKSGDS